MSKHYLNYLGIEIEYTLQRKDVKNINLRINSNGEVSISAPKRMKIAEIEDFAEKKAEWIIRKIAEIEKYRSVKESDELYDGKKVFVLGDTFTFCFSKDDTKKIEMRGQHIVLYTDDISNSQENKKLYLNWLKSISEAVFPKLLDEMYEKISDLNVSKPEIYIRNMKSRWGSCNPQKNKIGLNLQLIKSSPDCIRQVILHELIHLKYLNHGKEFYETLEHYMPNWNELKLELEKEYNDGIF